MNPCLYLVTGPTAVGKTKLCLRLALELDAEILSCDSMQLYQGMDIGTAKPSLEEMATVPHHGIGVFPMDRAASIQMYSKTAAQIVQDITARGKRVLVTGGSGFYLKSFLEPVCDEVEIPYEVRSEVARIQETSGLPALVERIHSLNPEGVGGLDLQNPRRVVRALERCMASGRTVLELLEEFNSMPEPFPDFEKFTCVLTRGDDSLKERIQRRTAEMLANGLVDEVEALMARGFLDNATGSVSIGYREVVAHLQGRSDPELDLAQEINRNTWRLVRRQRKWFRSQLNSYRSVDLDAGRQPCAAQLFNPSGF